MESEVTEENPYLPACARANSDAVIGCAENRRGGRHIGYRNRRAIQAFAALP